MAKKSEKMETKVKCPVCGSEFAIGEHEHTVKNATAIGKDSGLGDVYLTLSKRGEALKAAGMDPGRYFSMKTLSGEDCLMTYDDNGRPVPVSQDDPILQGICEQGTVPNSSLFRRWIMSQMFHALQCKGGITEWMRGRGYGYQWKMMIKELSDQAKLYAHRDMENFKARNRWFNKDVATAMAEDYIAQVKADCGKHKPHKCKGTPYIKYNREMIFVVDLPKKLYWPMQQRANAIAAAKNPDQLFEAVRDFWKKRCTGSGNYNQCAEWKDAFKGCGAYYTMQNMLRFHNCTFPMDNEFYNRRLGDLQMLEAAAAQYEDGEGWRLYGLMKQCIDENHIDIDKKMQEWSRAKSKREAELRAARK